MMTTFEFKLPDIGEGVVEGEIVRWLVKAGDTVREDQPLVEVMTDKATVTIPSPKPGRVVSVHGKEGEIAKVHGTLVVLEVDGVAGARPAASGPAAESAKPGVAKAKAAPPAAANGSSAARVLATPVTRRMAREHGIDLAAMAGTGPQGRVTKADVEAAMGGAVVKSAPAPRVTPVVAARADERIPLRGLRKRIAEKMVRSKFTAPHYTFVEEVDATELVSMRARLNAALERAKDPTKVSFLPLICKALVAALRRFPNLNANFDEASQELVVRGEFNFGIAAATAEGLTVPVVHGVDRLSVRGLADEVGRLSAAARERRLKTEDISGGTFTITSLGQTGGLFATPIINHPEVAILGVHRMRKRPVVNDADEIVIRQMMYVSLSFDHRVIDGAVGAEFAYELIRYLQQPELLLLEMT